LRNYSPGLKFNGLQPEANRKSLIYYWLQEFCKRLSLHERAAIFILRL